MKALIWLRFRALLAGFTRQGKRKNGKPRGKGMLVVVILLYLYLAVLLCAAMGFTFYTLAAPYHMMGLDWLYFAMAGLMALGFSLIATVFTTQSQLYDAKDNDLLLAMPLTPGQILLSRMIPLLAMNLLSAAIVMVPAIVVYASVVELLAPGLIMQISSLVGIVLAAQAIACLLGWLLHLLLSKVNKSFASVLFVVVFFVFYFSIYTQAERILAAMAANGQAIAGVLQSWVWPIYALGQGCLGSHLHIWAFTAIACLLFGLVYWLLSVSFLRSATARRSARRRKLDMNRLRQSSAGSAVCYKELRRFLGSPVYLTNMGLGVVFVAALAVAGILFRSQVLELAQTLLGGSGEFYPLIISAVLCVAASMMCISCPSISLEGKNLWILKSMPISTRQILLSKLCFHCRLATGSTALSGLILSLTYGCSLPGVVLCVLVSGLLTVISGLLGLICDLKWTRLDWISEAYPCKQSISVMIVMFSLMLLPIALGVLYIPASRIFSPDGYLAACTAALALVVGLLYRVLVTWGVKKWERL